MIQHLSHLKEAAIAVLGLGGAALAYKRLKNGAPPPAPTPGPAPAPPAPGQPVQHATPPPGGWVTGSQPGDTYGVVTSAGSDDTSNAAGTDLNPQPITDDTSSSNDALSQIASDASAVSDVASLLG